MNSIIAKGKPMQSMDVCGLILPIEPLSNFQLEDAAKKLGIRNFKGVVSRDELPKVMVGIAKGNSRGDSKKPSSGGCGIVNLDDSYGSGTHWVAYYDGGTHKFYFDPYGIQPPLEILRNLGPTVYYNSMCVQPPNTIVCGHLCLYVLKHLDEMQNSPLNCNKFNNILYNLI